MDWLLGFRDWLKRRISEVLRAGRDSAGAPVKELVFGAAMAVVVPWWMETPPPGAGKSLRAGS